MSAFASRFYPFYYFRSSAEDSSSTFTRTNCVNGAPTRHCCTVHIRVAQSGVARYQRSKGEN